MIIKKSWNKLEVKSKNQQQKSERNSRNQQKIINYILLSMLARKT